MDRRRVAASGRPGAIAQEGLKAEGDRLQRFSKGRRELPPQWFSLLERELDGQQWGMGLVLAKRNGGNGRSAGFSCSSRHSRGRLQPAETSAKKARYAASASNSVLPRSSSACSIRFLRWPWGLSTRLFSWATPQLLRL